MKNIWKKILSAVTAAAIIIGCVSANIVFAEDTSGITSENTAITDKANSDSETGSVSTSKINLFSDSGDTDSDDGTDIEEDTTTVRESKGLISASSENVSWPEGPEVDAESAIVMDANSGLVLYENSCIPPVSRR